MTGWVALLVGLALGYLVLTVLAEPARYVLLLGWRTVLGYVALWVLNLIGGPFGLHLPLNPTAAVVAGVLGVPGIVALWLTSRLYAGVV